MTYDDLDPERALVATVRALREGVSKKNATPILRPVAEKLSKGELGDLEREYLAEWIDRDVKFGPKLIYKPSNNSRPFYFVEDWRRQRRQRYAGRRVKELEHIPLDVNRWRGFPLALRRDSVCRGNSGGRYGALVRFGSSAGCD